jgi:Uma2 family endonuclease
MTTACAWNVIMLDAELRPVAERIQIMGMPAVSPDITTIAELLALPEDGMRHELLDGVHAVTPSPALLHQAVLREVMSLLVESLKGQDDLHLFSSPADVVLGPRTLVQPDVFVVRQQPGTRLRRWEDVGVPVLAVEFLSPGTAVRDRGVKRRIYQHAGVSEYWIVDLDARLVERWRPEDTRPEVLSETLEWDLPLGAGRLHIDLPSLFEKVLGP